MTSSTKPEVDNMSQSRI